MARPKSDDKRQNILQAATALFALEGLEAPTARIAKEAGVAVGTVFTYFATKDELLNQLYLELKKQLRTSLPAASVTPASAQPDMKEALWQAWQAYISWATTHPQERQVLIKLNASVHVTTETRQQATQSFCDVAELLKKSAATGVFRKHPLDFIGTVMGAMAEVTTDYIVQNPAQAKSICKDAFSGFWKCITA